MGTRRRRQGLQAQDLHHRLEHQERFRLGRQDSRRQKLFHGQDQKRRDDHKVHRHEVLDLSGRRLKVIDDLCLESAQAERRTICQVVRHGHPLGSQRHHLDIDRHKGVFQQAFLRHHSLQQAFDLFLQREPFQRNVLQRELQVLIDHPFLELKLKFVLKELVFRQLLIG